MPRCWSSRTRSSTQDSPNILGGLAVSCSPGKTGRRQAASTARYRPPWWHPRESSSRSAALVPPIQVPRLRVLLLLCRYLWCKAGKQGGFRFPAAGPGWRDARRREGRGREVSQQVSRCVQHVRDPLLADVEAARQNAPERQRVQPAEMGKRSHANSVMHHSTSPRIDLTHDFVRQLASTPGRRGTRSVTYVKHAEGPMIYPLHSTNTASLLIAPSDAVTPIQIVKFS
jgi:hypothetical protein